MQCPGPFRSCSRGCFLGTLCCLCGVLGHLAHVHRCARFACGVACAVSWATWLLFTGVPARGVVLRQGCPEPLGSCSPACSPGVLCCVCIVLGHLAPVHRCARSVCGVVCAVSWATCLLFTAWCVVLCVPCPQPFDSCSPVCMLGALCYVRSVLGHLAPVYRCARSARCVACAVSWATWLMFSGVLTWYVVLRARCPGSLGSCSPVCPPVVLCCISGVLGHLAPVHRCAHLFCCVVCAVYRATSLLCSGAPVACVLLRVRCPGPLDSCSPVRTTGVLCCVCGVLGHLAPVHQCARSARRAVCAVSWATWLLFTGVPAQHVHTPGVSCCVCRVLGRLTPVHQVACSVRYAMCAVS